ncbi:hypothetical protein LTR93_011684 [Exophiala xenobiotica]|nr:hypothetical protein LTR93_011684 [Exophiala xenobiotica]
MLECPGRPCHSSAVPGIFTTVKAKLGGPPTVVVYNAAALSPPAGPANPLTVSVEQLECDTALTSTSAYVAALETVAGFETLPKEVPKTFIYTGNILAAVTMSDPPYVVLALEKVRPVIGSASRQTVFRTEDTSKLCTNFKVYWVCDD